MVCGVLLPAHADGALELPREARRRMRVARFRAEKAWESGAQADAKDHGLLSWGYHISGDVRDAVRLSRGKFKHLFRAVFGVSIPSSECGRGRRQEAMPDSELTRLEKYFLSDLAHP